MRWTGWMALALSTGACAARQPLVESAPCAYVHHVAGPESGQWLATYSAPLTDSDVAILRQRLQCVSPSPTLTVEGAQVTVSADGVAAQSLAYWLDAATQAGQLSLHGVARWGAGKPAPGTAAPRPEGEVMWDGPERLHGGMPFLPADDPPPGLQAVVFDGMRPGGDYSPDVLLLEPAFVRGDVVTGARLAAEGRHRVEIDLNPQAAAALETFSAQRTGERVAIAVDGRVVAAPWLVGAISGERVWVDAWEAQQWADVLSYGALSAQRESLITQ